MVNDLVYTDNNINDAIKIFCFAGVKTSNGVKKITLASIRFNGVLIRASLKAVGC